MGTWLRRMAVMILVADFCGCWRNISPVDLSDAAIKARIETALRSRPDVNLRYVTVDVSDRVVTVSGIVESLRERDLIGRIARRAGGVERAVIDIVVPE